MKKVIALMAFLTLAAMGYTQVPRHLTGPKAKNYKPWLKSKSKANLAHIQVSVKKSQKMPVKSLKATRLVSPHRHFVANVWRGGRVFGPHYKNLKPWQKASLSKVLVAKAEPVENKPAKQVDQKVAP
ncbi:MAG: hypothetical protein HRU41_17305 [Saprospiraceae bacterium]|nr:hypothetical protein [Saprospiraceae bacterium]